MARLTDEEKKQRESAKIKKQREQRDAKMVKLYSKMKAGVRVYSVRSIAEQFGMSKSRVHVIVSGK
jgi:hypothetical protein